MRNSLFFLTLLGLPGLGAQSPDALNFGAQLILDESTTPPTYTFTWWGRFGAHYIVETSTDLTAPWTFLADHNPSGAEAPLGIQLVGDAPMIFFRTTQFDPADPSGLVDSDQDSLPDKWELYYFASLDRDGTADWNGDGLLERDAFRFGLNPRGTDESLLPAGREEYAYDARGWLEGYTFPSAPTVSLTLDPEGNVEGVSP